MWPELLFPHEGKVDFKTFYYKGVQNSTEMSQAYNRPAGTTMLYALLISGGGGGGGGRSAAIDADKGGGGGGASSNLTRLLIPWAFLPDTLHVQVGVGGGGGAANSNAQGGTRSSVTIVPQGASGSTANNVVYSANVNGGGGAGATNAAGTGGSATAAAGSSVFCGLGIFLAFSGQAGVAGGVHTGAVGTSVVWGSSGVSLSGGAGGAGTTDHLTNFAGGDITGAGLCPTILGGIAGGGAGNAGYWDLSRMIFTGGSGGGSNDDNGTGVGGRGGNGAFGCGGGGGGAGITGGAGGRGGDGLVFLASW